MNHWAFRTICLVVCGMFCCSLTQAEDKTSSNGTENAQDVVAEGVGLDAKKALNDAFRSAVRQVVGAVVDAKTVIKHDEVIEDKILTYSDGFVKTYEKLSEKKRDGLIRVKIQATVERQSLIRKLTAANITVKAVDGKGLFAEAVTKSEGKQDATSLLKKALTDLPTLLTAEVTNKPKFDSAFFLFEKTRKSHVCVILAEIPFKTTNENVTQKWELTDFIMIVSECAVLVTNQLEFVLRHDFALRVPC